MEFKKHQYKMYSFVLRHLSPIQKGIQSQHSIVEYIAENNHYSPALDQWILKDKTSVVLEVPSYEDLIHLIETFYSYKIRYAKFNEPDLNDMVTSVSVLVNEVVWDRTNYPNYEGEYNVDSYNEWVNNVMGGEKNAVLRQLINNYKLAQ